MLRNYSLLFSLFILTMSMFAPITAVSQPPVITDTLYVGGGMGWGPEKADPVLATFSEQCALIKNVYDTLIAMNGELYWDFVPLLTTSVPMREEMTKAVTSVDVNLANPTESNWSDDSKCIGWVDNHATGNLDTTDTLYMMDPDGSYHTWFVQSFDDGPPVSITLWHGRYVFHIRTDPIINFVNETGQEVDTFDIYDAEYSLERDLVQDHYYGAVWTFYKPLFDQLNSDFAASNTTEPTAMSLAHLIDDAVEVSGNDLTINVGIPFPDTAFKQSLTQTWASIISKQFSISIGCWNGDLYADGNGDGYPDWWAQWRQTDSSPYDTPGAVRYVGTGPYRVTLFDPVNYIVKLSRNPGYWRGWPASGSKGYLETVEIHYIFSAFDRFGAFNSCSLDVLHKYRVPPILMPIDINPNINNITSLPELSLDGLFFTFTINQTSGFIGSGQFPNGVPTDFFNNTHVRRAFAYAVNHTQFIEQQYGGKARWRSTPLIQGLYPEYHTGITGYDRSFDLAESELKSAIFNGQSVWEAGFNLSMAYMSNWPPSLDEGIVDALSSFFAQLSTYDNRRPEWPDFVIGAKETTFATILQKITDFELPAWTMGWLADIPDADSFMRPYMYSGGDFARLQNYTAVNGWGSHKDELLDLAVKTADGAERAVMYAELEQIYVNDCPSLPLAQPLAWKGIKYWVKGWCYNLMNPSQYVDYYYPLWKEDTCWADVTGQTEGVPDDVCNMRDIGYVCSRFTAIAPDPSRTPPYDPRWGNGTYGSGCADLNGDRRVDMRDIGFACAHFGHRSQR